MLLFMKVVVASRCAVGHTVERVHMHKPLRRGFIRSNVGRG